MEGENPNEVLVPYYEEDEIIYITPPEYYCRLRSIIGSRAIKITKEDNPNGIT